jgi:exopolyphosphatase / guanosine-5'-triphosphate,3'-diphosphate pyrophosphatase
MKLAAIDIGSNAVRLQITNVIAYGRLITFKKLEYIRFPLRLGHDVFTKGKISKKNEDRLVKLMQAFKNLIDLYQVEQYYGCATSAMRESGNGKDIVRRIKQELDLSLHIISGEREAELINNVIRLNLDEGSQLHIDVGGGSTELNLYSNRDLLKAHSFPIGSVRSLEKIDLGDTWKKLEKWVQKNVPKKEKLVAIGTGGNINKLLELSPTSKTSSRKMTLESLLGTTEMLKNLTMDDMLLRLQLNPDRADVIIPAAEIYIKVMKLAKIKTIHVPDIGLKDGINLMLYERAHPLHDKVIVRN